MHVVRNVILAIVAVVALTVLAASLYVVGEQEQIIITQFGKAIGEPVVTAGLKIKVPFIQKVNRFERRILEWDGRANDITQAVIGSLDKTDRFLDHLNIVGQRVTSGEGNVGRLFMDDKLYESMLITADRLSLVIEEFQALLAEWRQGKVRVSAW